MDVVGESRQMRMMRRVIVLKTACSRGIEIAIEVPLLDDIVGLIEPKGAFKVEPRAINEHQTPFQVMRVVDQTVVFRKAILGVFWVQDRAFFFQEVAYAPVVRSDPAINWHSTSLRVRL